MTITKRIKAQKLRFQLVENNIDKLLVIKLTYSEGIELKKELDTTGYLYSSDLLAAFYGEAPYALLMGVKIKISKPRKETEQTLATEAELAVEEPAEPIVEP